MTHNTSTLEKNTITPKYLWFFVVFFFDNKFLITLVPMRGQLKLFVCISKITEYQAAFSGLKILKALHK